MTVKKGKRAVFYGVVVRQTLHLGGANITDTAYALALSMPYCKGCAT